jgi:hypothetical protein
LNRYIFEMSLVRILNFPLYHKFERQKFEPIIFQKHVELIFEQLWSYFIVIGPD